MKKLKVEKKIKYWKFHVLAVDISNSKKKKSD